MHVVKQVRVITVRGPIAQSRCSCVPCSLTYMNIDVTPPTNFIHCLLLVLMQVAMHGIQNQASNSQIIEAHVVDA